MGGGGGGGGPSLGDLSELIAKARQELNREAGRRNVFLSFAYEDLAEVNLLRGQAQNDKSGLEFNDWSVKEPYESSRSDYIKRRIAERIAQSSLTVLYLSPNVLSSAWVRWEVEYSLQLKKEVIAVYAGANPPTTMPDYVKKSRIPVVAWGNLAERITALPKKKE